MAILTSLFHNVLSKATWRASLSLGPSPRARTTQGQRVDLQTWVPTKRKRSLIVADSNQSKKCSPRSQWSAGQLMVDIKVLSSSTLLSPWPNKEHIYSSCLPLGKDHIDLEPWMPTAPTRETSFVNHINQSKKHFSHVSRTMNGRC